MLGWPCHYRQQRLHINLFLTLPPILILFPHRRDDDYLVSRLVWATSLSCSHDCLDGTFLLDEAIIEAMNGSNNPWDDMHHHSYFLPELERIDQDEF
jgi:hypothetical protein